MNRKSLVLLTLTTLIAGSCALGLAACGKSKQPPVVVIGLDGADFDLLVPWMEAGELPNLKAFFEEARIGELTTVYPILSPVCWTSAMTGVNPGKHGIFDFQKEDPAGGEPLIEQATNRRATPIWMLLSESGRKVGILNVPMTFPPDPVRGRMVSGFPFPSGDVNLTYPPELQEELGDYPVDFLGLSLFSRTPDQMYADFIKGMEARTRVALDWIESGDSDFLWFVFTGPDKVQHFFWKFMDPQHPSYTADGAAAYGSKILDLWKLQDAALGRILAALPPDATVMFLSDHGFEGIYRQVNMGNWLPKTPLVDWLTTHAIPPMLLTNGILHYVLEGQLSGAADREEFIDVFSELCRGLVDPATGQAPFESIFRREDIYSGRMLEKAPDVVFQETPHYFVTRGVPDSTDLPVFQDVWTTSFSAHHRPEGILALKGPSVAAPVSAGSLRERLAAGGDFNRAHILDIMPTLLVLMREAIPDAVDGRVLEEALVPAFLAENPPRMVPVPGFLLDRLPPSQLSEMRALPYLN